MALPNPGMDAVPFTPLTAEFLDDMIENIESLSDGTGFENGAITTNTLAESAVTRSKIDFSTFVNYYTNISTITTITAGNFSGTSTRSSQSVTIPANCTRALVVATVRLQTQGASANDMSSRVQIGGSGNSTGTGIVTGVGTFNGSMSTMLGILTVSPGSNTFDLVCTAGSSASASNYTCLVIPLPS